jgi:transposase-like protein
MGKVLRVWLSSNIHQQNVFGQVAVWLVCTADGRKRVPYSGSYSMVDRRSSRRSNPRYYPKSCVRKASDNTEPPFLTGFYLCLFVHTPIKAVPFSFSLVLCSL